MNPKTYWPLLLAALMCFTTTSFSQTATPAGDELGMARTLGHATWTRCAAHLAYPKSKSYELSYVRSKHHAPVAVRRPA